MPTPSPSQESGARRRPGQVEHLRGRARAPSTSSSSANSGSVGEALEQDGVARGVVSPSASARSGVMPTPAPISATLRRVRARGLSRPYGPSTSTRVPGRSVRSARAAVAERP